MEEIKPNLSNNHFKLWQVWYKYMWTYKNVNEYSSDHIYKFFSVVKRVGKGKTAIDKEVVAYYNLSTNIYNFDGERFTKPEDMLDYILEN